MHGYNSFTSTQSTSSMFPKAIPQSLKSTTRLRPRPCRPYGPAVGPRRPYGPPSHHCLSTLPSFSWRSDIRNKYFRNNSIGDNDIRSNIQQSTFASASHSYPNADLNKSHGKFISLAEWEQTEAVLMAQPVWDESHWHDAERLLQAFYQSHMPHGADQVRRGLALLDRLYQEKSPEPSYFRNNHMEACQLQPFSLTAVLVAWRNCLLANGQNLFPDRPASPLHHHERQQQQQGGVHDSLIGFLGSWLDSMVMQPVVSPLSASEGHKGHDDLHPDLIYSKLKQYYDPNLSFLEEPSPMPWGVLLHVVAHASRQPVKVQEIMNYMSEHPHLHLGEVSYLEHLAAFRCARKPQECDIHFRKYLQQMVDGQLPPGTISKRHVSVAMAAWGDVTKTDPQAAHRAQALFDLATPIMPGVWGDHVPLNTLLWAWAKSHESVDPSDQVEDLFHQFVRFHDSKDVKSSEVKIPYATIYHPFFVGLSRARHNAIPRMEKHLKVMEQEHRTKPNIQHFNALLSACSPTKKTQKAQQIFDLIKRKYEEGDKGFLPTVKVYKNLYHTYAAAGHPEQVTRVMNEMTRMYKLGLLEEKPDASSWSSLFHAWQVSNDPAKSHKAEQELLKLIQRVREGDKSVCPITLHFNTVLFIISEEHARTKDRALTRRAHMLLELMEKLDHNVFPVAPNHRTYNILMAMHSRQHEPNSMEQLFQKMVAGYKAGNDDLRPHYNEHITRLQAWSRTGEPEKTKRALADIIADKDLPRPTSRQFCSVLHSWMKSKRADAGEKAEIGLRQMKELSKKGVYDCAPDHYAYGAVVSAHAKANLSTSGERAWCLLQELDALAASAKGPATRAKFEPDLVTYMDCMSALTRPNCVYPERERAVYTILAKRLPSKPAVFWEGNRNRALLKRIPAILHSSGFASQQRLIDAHSKLMLKALGEVPAAKQENKEDS